MSQEAPAEILVEDRFVDVPGGVVFSRMWRPAALRSSAPLILIHDSLGCVELWRDFPPALAGRLGRVVVAYDRLGFGRSSARIGLPSPGFIGEEVELYFPRLIEALGIGGYALFGHSVGGGMALCIAARDLRCEAVISESAQAFVEARTLEGVRAARETFRDPRQFARLTRWHGEKARWVLDAWTEVWLAPERVGWSLREELPHITCPVLVLHGDADEFGSEAFPETICRLVGGPCERVLLRDCGHIPHREKMEEVLAHVARFMGSESF